MPSLSIGAFIFPWSLAAEGRERQAFLALEAAGPGTQPGPCAQLATAVVEELEELWLTSMSGTSHS